MAKTYGVGIMGAGNISSAYLRLAPLFKNLEVRAVADIVPEAARVRADEFGVAAQTPDELLKNSEIDVIVNLTIPGTHYSVSSDIISAGKHAYSEKPFVLTVNEGLALKSAAEERGLKVGSAPDTFLGGVHQQAREIIDSGKLGKIMSGTTHLMSRGMEHWHPNPGFFFQPGGGPVLDLGPYYIANLVQLLGPVKRLSAFTNRGRVERLVTAEGPMKGRSVPVETPTTIHGVLEFQSGAIITLGASWDVAAHGHHNIELYGADGSIFISDPNYFGGDLRISDLEGTLSDVEAWDHPFGVPNFELDRPIPRANYRCAGLADMMDTFETGGQARCGIDLALHVVEVMTGLLKAGDLGQVQIMQTTCERPAALGPEAARALLRV